MSIIATTTFTAPDPDVAPATFADAVEQLNSLVGTTIESTTTTVIIGVEIPDVEDQDKVWYRKNTLGNPVGAYIFTQGVWVRDEPPVSARFGIYTGDPTGFFSTDDSDAGKGLKGPGPIALDYWGWALMNGNNGTANWSDRFLIGAAMDNESVTGWGAPNWRTGVNGDAEVTGGVSEILLDTDNTFGSLTVGRYDSDPSAEDSAGGPLYGNPGGDHEIDILANTEPLAVSVVNPFYAVAYIQFIGYL